MNLSRWVRFLVFMQLLTLVCVQALAQTSLGYKTFNKDNWDFELGQSYFKSDSNYPESGGSATTLPLGGQYTLWQTGIGTRFLPSEHWALYSTLFVGNSESKNNLASRTNSTLSHVLVGTELLAYSEGFEVIPELYGIFPIEKISESADVSLNNEGVIEGTGALTLQMDIGLLQTYGSLGYTFRDEQRSSLMPWAVGGELRLLNSRLGAQLNGFQTVQKDTDVDNGRKLIRSTFLNRVNAGSNKFYSPDPSLVRAQIHFKHSFGASAWSFGSAVGFTVAGTNSAAGFDAMAILRYSFDMSDNYRVTPVRSRPVPKFKEDVNDGVDQSLFQTEDQIIYKEPMPSESFSSSPAKPSLQQQLDQTEMKIELKANKKKKKR